LKYCPICKKKPTDKNLATWIEWEIKEERISKPTGVTSCCVFTYAIPKNEVRRKYLGNHERVIVNEFGKKYTGSDFLNMLKYNCITKKMKIRAYLNNLQKKTNIRSNMLLNKKEIALN